MAEIDPVVLELIARNDRYIAELRKTTRTADQQLGLQEKRVRRLENEFQRSSNSIASTLRGLAGTLATYFTGRELIGLIDSFTRFQNQLKVAGLEGEDLARVQERLRTIGGQYGVELEGLANIFSRVSQVQKELGASQEQIIRLNEIVAASLKVAGTDAQSASGALLQLSQALGSGVVRAEEFNSILEGALPLAQAAARGIDGMEGSVAKLRQAVVDGNVTSREFFEGVLRGGTQTIKQAESATLTLAGAFTSLRNELTIYFGEAGKGSGATEALASAIKALADNIDVLIPALAVIAGAMGVRMVAGAVAASGAIRALTAYLSIATTSLAGTALAARGAGAALLAAFGGPIGVALAALTLGIGYIVVKSNEATKATGAYANAQTEAARITERAAKVAQDLAGAHGKVRQEALAAARAERENTKQKLAGARASVVLARAELAKARAFQQGQNRASFGAGGVPGTGAFIQGSGDKALAQAQGNLAAAQSTVASLEKSIESIAASINAATAPSVAPVGAPGKSKKNRGGASGPSIADIESRFADEMANYAQQTWGAMRSTATSAEKRAELELRGVELARKRTLEEIAADADYSAAQKEKLRLAVEVLAEAEREAIAFARRVQLEQEAADLASDRHQAEQDALRLQYDLANTEADRRRIALDILDAEDRYLRSKEEAILASETATEAEKARARIALDALDATAGARREVAARQHEGALGRYARHAGDFDARIEEITADRIQDINETITDTLADTLGIDDPFLKDLLFAFLNRNIFGPLAEAFSQQGGGGGLLGGIVGAIGSIFGGGGGPTNLLAGTPYGRASGGSVSAGTVYRINEGASPGRVEAFQPAVSGQIIPLGRMDALRGAAGASGGVVRVIIEEGPGFAARVRTEATGVAVEVTRAAAPQIIDAATRETFRQSNRGKM